MSEDIELELTTVSAGVHSSIELAAVTDLSADLPGLRVQITGIRTALRLRAADDGGRLSFVADFTPPTVGGGSVRLDLPGVRGGGYLQVAGDEWRGAVSADLGPVSVGGFAILTTEDFSLLVLLAAEFPVPIQLSFGFALRSVGGVIGINRHPDVDALRAGLGTGNLGAALLPRDAVAEAPRLLPVLSGFFPRKPGAMIAGPIVEIVWGTPALVSAVLAVLVSTDGVLIAGRVALSLPFEQAAVIRLQASVLGTVTAEGLSIDASLHDSHLAGMPVRGDIAIRVGGNGDGLFVISAGGFHPAFAPPAGLTGMRRIGAEISPGPLLTARLEAYLAITTGSVQFGAAAELTAGIGGFGIRGRFGFDALICLDPFGFDAGFTALVAVRCADFDVASVQLRGRLCGTAPWKIRAHARIEILWFDVDVDIPEITWGERRAASLPSARDPGEVLRRELLRPQNWSASDRGVVQLVRLRAEAEQGAVVHPLAEVVFEQHAVPLGLRLTRMDSVPLPEPIELAVTAAGTVPRRGRFLPGQFLDLDDNAKLAGAGYAEFESGFTLPVTPALGDVEPVTTDPEAVVLRSGSRLIARVDRELRLTAELATPRLPAPLIELRDPAACIVAGTRELRAETAVVAAAIGAEPARLAEWTAHGAIAESLARGIDPVALQPAYIWEVAS